MKFSVTLIMILSIQCLKSQINFSIDSSGSFQGISVGKPMQSIDTAGLKISIQNVESDVKWKLRPIKVTYRVQFVIGGPNKFSKTFLYLNSDSNNTISSIIIPFEDQTIKEDDLIKQIGAPTRKVSSFSGQSILWQFLNRCIGLLKNEIMNCLVIYDCKIESILTKGINIK